MEGQLRGAADHLDRLAGILQAGQFDDDPPIAGPSQGGLADP
jgi:hypothetical protein